MKTDERAKQLIAEIKKALAQGRAFERRWRKSLEILNAKIKYFDEQIRLLEKEYRAG